MRYSLAMRILLIFLLLNYFTNDNLVYGQNNNNNNNNSFSDKINFDFSNIIGSDGPDYPRECIIDVDGNLIVATNSIYIERANRPLFYNGPVYKINKDYQEFNITDDAWDTSYNGLGDIVLTKFNSNGDIIWSTYFGGEDSDQVDAMVINDDNEIILFGQTDSIYQFPFKNETRTEPSEIQSTFIAKFDSNGFLLFSTFFGGSYLDSINHAMINSKGEIVFSGFTKSNDFPLINPIIERIPVDQFNPTAILGKFSVDFELIFSTQVGGTKNDNDFAFTLTPNDDIIMVGVTKSLDFPITDDAIDKTHNGLIDTFYTKFSKDGELLYSTYFGGTYVDWIDAVVIDNDNNTFLTGYTVSNDFPIVNGEDEILNDGIGRYSDAVIIKLSENATVLYSSYFGGNNADRAINLHITEDGGAILIGETKSITFPIFGVDDENIKINNGVIYDSGDPPSDIFVAKFLNNGKLNWSILFGSSGVDNIYSADYKDNRLVIVGNTNNIMDFPKDNAFKGGYMLDGFMIKLSFEAFSNNNLSDDNLSDDIGEIEDSMNSNMENQVNQNMKELNDNENSFDIISYGVIGLTLGIPIINIFRKNNIMDRILKRNSLSSTNNELSDYLNKIRNE